MPKHHTPKIQRFDPLLTPQKGVARKSPLIRSVSDTSKARIHRVRFVDHLPSAVSSIALTPASFDSTLAFSHANRSREILAVGRGNGNVEIHAWIGLDGAELARRPGGSKSHKQAWVIQSTLPAHLPSGAVDNLVFAHQTSLSESDLDLISSAEEGASATQALIQTPPRLFSTSSSSTLYEWDWLGSAAGRHKATLSSEGGNIWSLAVNPSSTSLAMGCEDGVIRIINIADGELEIVRRLEKVNTRPLSLAWGPPAPRSQPRSTGKGKEKATEAIEAAELLDDVYLVAGGADSNLRKWDLRSGRCISKMQTDQAGRDPTLVWAVAVLNDHTIISADSMGVVKFWDGKMGTQRQSHKAHKADVLCMAVAADQRSIYTSGIDQMTVQISLISADKSQPPDTNLMPQWIITSTRRLHTHDVTALAHSPAMTSTSPTPDTTKVPLLLSGGIDMAVTLTPAAPAGLSDYAQAIEKLGNPLNEAPSTVFDRSTPRKIPYVPQRNRVVHIARDAKLLLLQNDASLTVWRMTGRVGSSTGSVIDDTDEGWHKCCEISLTCATNIVTSAISADGRWLAVTDRYETKLFSLAAQVDGSIEPKRIKTFTTMLESHPLLSKDRAASALVFTPDSRRLVLASLTTSQLAVIRLPLLDLKQCEVVKVFSHHASATDGGRALAGATAVNGKANGVNGTNGHPDMEEDSSEDEQAAEAPASVATMRCLAVSDDNQWLASVDMARRIHVFHLDSLQHHGMLPSTELPPSALAFIPLSPSHLVIGLPNNTLQIFDVELKRLAPWARSLVSEPIEQLAALREPLIGLAFEPLHGKGSSSASASPLPSPLPGHRSTPLSFGSASPAPKPRIPVVVAWGSTWLCRIRLPQAMPASATPRGSKKRSAASADTSSSEEQQPQQSIKDEDVQVLTKYQPLLALDFLAPGELIVVERPYHTMVADLPPAYYPAGKYGT